MTTWTIHTYGTGDYLRFVFNGVAAIMGEDNYFVLLKTSAIVGLLSILITSAFKQGRSNYTSVLMVMAFYMAVVIPKVNIEIKDEIVPGNSAIVSNIPVGLGVPAAAFSKLGFWLTKGFETVFSLPHQIKYSGNGLLFAQKLVEESTRFVITDPRLSSNFSEFWKGCVYYDLFLGLYTWTEILKSDDLSSFISQKTSQTRGFTYENHDGSRSIVTCRVAYNDLLMKDLENEIKMAQRIHGMRIVPNKKTVNDTIAEFSTSMPIAYQYLTGISKSNSQIMSQNILANSFRRGFMNFASNVDASAAAEDFALAKAEASRKTTFNTLGKIAKKHLPELQGIFEAFIYSIFTIVVMLAMLPVTTKVFSYYTFALMWINLWPPLYAIINFCINYFSQKASTAVVAQSGQAFSTGISLMTSTGLGNVLSDYAAVAGYFSLSIPMISFMILNKSGGMMASMASRLMEGYDGPVSKAAEDSTSGNIQLGQMSYDNQTAFQANEAPSYNSGYTKNTDHDGFSTTSTSNGEYINAPMSSTPANVSWSEMTSNTLSKQQSEAEQLAATSSSDTLNSLGIAQNEINSKINSLNENRSNSNSWSENDSKSLSEITNESERIVNDVSKRIGHTYSDVDNLMGEISGMASVSGGLKVPLTNTGAELRAQLSARYNKSYNWISDENLNKVHNAMTSSEYISAMRDEANTINNLMAKYDKSFLESESKNLNNTVNNLESASMRKSEAFSKLSNISNITSNIKSFQSAISIKGDDGFMSWLSDKGFSNNDIKTLYSNVNKGNIGAKNEHSMIKQEYIKSYTDNFNSNDFKILKMILKRTMNQIETT
ncbi:MAG: conjugal transfer protein TraG N-terminal domain-containing protein [Halobacteriovoraceae bacterium]|nr:conjugal transfer protein TraG N-terminal domain-containing protein [Halobacteriovoraceae bacterium]